MSICSYSELYEIIVKVVRSKLSSEGLENNNVNEHTDLMELLDSFSLLDVIIEIEERANVSADLAQMNIANTMTVSDLIKEIIQINGCE